MATKKEKQKPEVNEREYVIPLREKWRRVPRYKRAKKAIKAIKEFVAQHMKIRDRDLKKIKIDNYLNEEIWFRGITNPPHKIKVKANKEGDVVRVELVDLPTKMKFKKQRADKLEASAVETLKKKKTFMEKAKEGMSGEAKEESKSDAEIKQDKSVEKEKAKAGEEASKKLEKTTAKQMKHSAGGKAKQKTQPVRKALAK